MTYAIELTLLLLIIQQQLLLRRLERAVRASAPKAATIIQRRIGGRQP